MVRPAVPKYEETCILIHNVGEQTTVKHTEKKNCLEEGHSTVSGEGESTFAGHLIKSSGGTHCDHRIENLSFRFCTGGLISLQQELA